MIKAKIRRSWNSGELLRAFALGQSCPRFDIGLRSPTARDLGDHFDRARSWAELLERGSRGGQCYRLEYGTVGGRTTGRSRIPKRALVSSFEQVFRFLGTSREAQRFLGLIEGTEHEEARSWALTHPLLALDKVEVWEQIGSAVLWLEAQRNRGRYLREVDADGVDTKFIETNLGVLAGILDVPASRRDFERALGMASKPRMVRMRYAPGSFALPGSEAILRLDELQDLCVRPDAALIVENEVTYLSVPTPPGVLVLWGRGYAVDHPASVNWLRDADVAYWGDIDTDGLAILNRTRRYLPNVRSILMDRETLLRHQDRWSIDPRPRAAELSNLADAEQQLYQELLLGTLGRNVRLEQERIAWDWALERLDDEAWRGCVLHQ